MVMTKQEEEALKRLEVNVARLVELVDKQRKIIDDLRCQQQQSEKDLSDMQAENEKLKSELNTKSIALNLTSGNDATEVKSYLSGIISQVDDCINMLETELI